MPVTPYHFGIGAALKAVGPSRFSLVAFVLSQLIIDLEPLYYLLTNSPPWHRFMHTFAGATVVVLLTVIFARLFRRVLGRIWQWGSEEPFELHDTSRLAVLIGAVTGAYSHIWVDSIMHDDVYPMAPFSYASPIHGLTPILELEQYCLSLGVVGLAVLAFRFREKWNR